MSLELANPNTVKVLPQSLGLEPELLLSGIVARANNYFSANPENGYLPNQVVSLSFPFEMLDLRSAQLQFTLTGVNPTGVGTFVRYQKDIRSIFSRITVRFGSKYVLDTQNSGMLYNVLDQTLDLNWANSVGAITTGTSDNLTTRNTDFANPNKTYAVQLYTNEDSYFYNVFPLHKLSVQMYVDFYLAPASQVIETDYTGANASYIMNNVQFHCASLVPSESWNSLYNSRVLSGITYTYFNYEYLYDSNILAVNTTSCQKLLTYKYASVIGLIFVMTDKNPTQTTLNKLNKFNNNNVSVAYVKIGNQQFPIDQMRNNSDLLYMFAETMGLSMRFPFAGSVNWDSTTFVGAIPLARQIKENRDINLSLDGLNTSLGTSMQLTLGFNPVLPSAQDLHIWAIVENTITYNPNGSVTFNN